MEMSQRVSVQKSIQSKSIKSFASNSITKNLLIKTFNENKFQTLYMLLLCKVKSIFVSE